MTEEEQIKIAQRMGLIAQLPSGLYDGSKKNKEYVIRYFKFLDLQFQSRTFNILVPNASYLLILENNRYLSFRCAFVVMKSKAHRNRILITL